MQTEELWKNSRRRKIELYYFKEIFTREMDTIFSKPKLFEPNFTFRARSTPFRIEISSYRIFESKPIRVPSSFEFFSSRKFSFSNRSVAINFRDTFRTVPDSVYIENYTASATDKINFSLPEPFSHIHQFNEVVIMWKSQLSTLICNSWVEVFLLPFLLIRNSLQPIKSSSCEKWMFTETKSL